MATFLSIPRELRDQILRDAVVVEDQPPVDPVGSLDREHMVCKFGPRMGVTWDEAAPIWIKRPTAPTTGASLVRVNRQLREEVTEILGAKCRLDVMFVKGCGLWPTWLSAPAPVRHVDSLYTQFRMFDHPRCAAPKRWDTHQFMFFQRRIFYLEGALSHYYLLAGFLQGGSGATCAYLTGAGCRCTVKNLILDVSLPDPAAVYLRDDEEEEFAGIRGSFFRKSRFRDLEKWPSTWPRPVEIDPRYTQAETLAYFMWTKLCRLLRLGPRTLEDSSSAPRSIEYGRILYEGIGVIEIRVNGEARKSINLTQWLDRQPASDPFGVDPEWSTRHRERQDDFVAWKAAVESRRKEYGLWDEEALQKGRMEAAELPSRMDSQYDL